MSILLLEDQIRLYDLAIKGEIKLIAWGFRSFFYFQRWQEIIPLHAIVDANYLLWDKKVDGYKILNPLALKDFDPKKHALISYFQSGWVREYVERISGMPVLDPLPLQHICRLVDVKNNETFSPIKMLDEPVLKNVLSKIDLRGDDDERTEWGVDLLRSYDWQNLVSTLCATMRPSYKVNKKTVVLAGNSLTAGGAERQMINLALGFVKKGWRPTSLSILDDVTAKHYKDKLLEHHIPVRHIFDDPETFTAGYKKRILMDFPYEVRLILWHLPIHFTMRVACTMRFLQESKPELVIAYLDWPSTVVGLAAVLCGVPHIVISGRNYPPTRMPHFFGGVVGYMERIYQILALQPNVHFTNNSVLAGKAYADWLNLPVERVTTVANCLTQEFMKKPSQKMIDNVCFQYNLKKTDKIILGVFRLAPEKRPMEFVAVFEQILKQVPSARAIICGDGSMRPDVVDYIKERKLDDRIILLGVTDQVKELMSVSRILLHTAMFEGMPNVMLEAQSQALPVVCVRSGGVMDCLAPSLSSYAFDVDDCAALVPAAVDLLKNNKKRVEIGLAAQKYVRRHFSVAALIDRNLDVAFQKQKRK